VLLLLLLLGKRGSAGHAGRRQRQRRRHGVCAHASGKEGGAAQQGAESVPAILLPFPLALALFVQAGAAVAPVRLVLPLLLLARAAREAGGPPDP
jgi:hypothetical protein